MDIFYKDKESTFKCKVEIDGASLSDSFARLVLKFNSISYLFYGKLDGSGKCKVKVPALKNCPDDDGQLILEIIADSMFFEPYTGKFHVKKSKNVTIERDIDDDEEEKIIKPKVSVIKEEVDNHITFTSFYKSFVNQKINETKNFKNYKPSEEVLNLAKKKINGSIDNEIDKIFMLYLDKYKIKS